MSEPEITPHCPHCGSPFVRPTPPKAMNEYLLRFVRRVPFQCQVCARRFTVPNAEPRMAGATPDRRHFDRLATRLPATFVDETGKEASGIITDLSLAGGQLQTRTQVARDASLRLVLHPAGAERPLVIERAIVRSVSPQTVGLQFLLFAPGDRARLSQLVRALLVERHTAV